jgi:D,D-heptose 1,7-bisphosphate phosphatase
VIKMKRAVFLDRDGTLARDIPYCSRPEDFELLPCAAESIKLFNEASFKVVIITNQSGIARGYFTEEMLENIHQKMRSDLAKYNARIDSIYFCPHHPDEGCDCRKPKPTLILRAAQEHDIDLTASFFIGDTPADIEAGHAAGCKTVIISHASHEEAASEGNAVKPDFKCNNLQQASEWIFKNH